MKAESLDASYLALPDGAGSFPGVAVIHEAFRVGPAHDKACGAISLRRHCPGQVVGVAVRS